MGITLFGGSPPGLNPVSGAISQSAYFIQQLEFKSLSPVATETGTPDLSTSATDWISHNSNYTQWIFNIQPGLKWSNGQPVNASDILATFSSRFAFNSSYDYLGLGQYVKSEFALNSSAVEFNLNQSYAHWPEAIGGTDGYSWLYPASMADQGAGSLFNGTNIADGPFYVSNFVPGQTQMVLLRNPYYEPLPEVCQINVNFVESLSQTATYLLAGTSDLAPVAPATAVSLLQHNNLHVMHPPASLMVTMEYNVTTYPYNMTAFRQALAYGINESQILQRAFYGFGQTAYTSQGMVPTTSSLYNPNQVKYDYSMSNATALLNSINIVKGSDGYLHYPNGTLATLTIWTDSEQSPDPVAANIVATNLQALGFKVNLQVTTKSNIFGDFGSNAPNIEHDLVIWDMAGPEFGDAWIDAQPAWSTYWTAGVPNSHWEYPPSPDAQYQGNLSIVDSTASNTLLQQSLNNIQSLNAKYLPTLV
ncbi:MAG: ABC transporter substrate-binding protein, partial [Thaumarchaeota archaeon]|nr:ABC transporter substrate-binding protein [Nitrososphaerota archaeon]